jgi:hypothetical protein
LDSRGRKTGISDWWHRLPVKCPQSLSAVSEVGLSVCMVRRLVASEK